MRSVRATVNTSGIGQEITEITSAPTNTSSTQEKNEQSRTKKLSIHDVLRSFSGNVESSLDDENCDLLDEIHEYMKRCFSKRW